MPIPEEPAKKYEIKPPVKVLAVCPDGHETGLEVAPMLAQVGSITGEQCLKLGSGAAVACGKYLKVKQVLT